MSNWKVHGERTLGHVLSGIRDCSERGQLASSRFYAKLSNRQRYGFISIAFILLLLVAGAALIALLSPGRILPSAQGYNTADSQSFETIERGRYLATAGDCVACHSVPGGRPFAGGLALETPFGVLVASNITPDRETGIGAWTDEEFVRAVRAGVGRNGEYLYPAMPYPAYAKVARDDVLAIRAFLKTIEPVKNRVLSNQLPFPFNIRTILLGWNLLNFKAGDFKSRANKSPEWNRGAYLVEGLGHCGACHTPKTVLGGDKSNGFLEGAVLQGWFAPDLTSDARKGIGAWSVDDLVRYLKTGANHLSIASGPMTEEIVNSSSRMTEQDLRSIAVYIKDLRDGATDRLQPLPPTDMRMIAGQAIYKDVCAACHVDAGTGAPNLFPRLAGNAIVQSDDATTLIRMLLQGSRGAGTRLAPTAPAMPSMAGRLSDDQIAAVLTYIRNAWGNAASAVSGSRVRCAQVKPGDRRPVMMTSHERRQLALQS